MGVTLGLVNQSSFNITFTRCGLSESRDNEKKNFWGFVYGIGKTKSSSDSARGWGVGLTGERGNQTSPMPLCVRLRPLLGGMAMMRLGATWMALGPLLAGVWFCCFA